MNPRPFEQYQLSCIEERPSGAALIFYLSNFNIAWIFITETNAEISNRMHPSGMYFLFALLYIAASADCRRHASETAFIWDAVFSRDEICTPRQAFEGSCASRKESS